MLIEADRISRAGAVLPLTQREEVPASFGTRHRAGMGIAERSDALIIVVSEERGEVTLMHGLEIVPMRNSTALAAQLDSLTSPRRTSPSARARRWFFSEVRYKLAALGIAAGVYLISQLGAGSTVRIVSVPVEFTRVPAGAEIATQSATRLEVQLRGASWLLASVQMTGLVARFDLGQAGVGVASLKVKADNLSLPPGITLERVRPETISVRLVRGPS
jgi:hypothetical protein